MSLDLVSVSGLLALPITTQLAKRNFAKPPLIVRVHELIREKGFTQKQQISKWLNGEHNFTLRSLAKLQAELGEPIIQVPKRHFQHAHGLKKNKDPK